MRIVIAGSGAREHAMAVALKAKTTDVSLFCCGSHVNPGILPLADRYRVMDITDPATVAREAAAFGADIAIIGPEAPLEKGVADALQAAGIPTVGPTQSLARIETSKAFARTLLADAGIDASPAFRHFRDMEGVLPWLHRLGEGRYVLKADGLTGGKGVMVAGEHVQNFAEAMRWCESLTACAKPFVIEEKLNGEEFSLLAFCDGKRLVPMPLVQDHKRAFVHDEGPNTGGMGAYTDANHTLPFLAPSDVDAAMAINEAALEALQARCGEAYRGILYGSYMATAEGVRLIEFNARFGDPEALNLLTLLESDFARICLAMARGSLEDADIRFMRKASVCKYAVPRGYPGPSEPTPVTVGHPQTAMYYGSVEMRDGVLHTAGSRTLAVVGIGDCLQDAERDAEAAMAEISGDLYHREDIGTSRAIASRVAHMQALRETAEAI